MPPRKNKKDDDQDEESDPPITKFKEKEDEYSVEIRKNKRNNILKNKRIDMVDKDEAEKKAMQIVPDADSGGNRNQLPTDDDDEISDAEPLGMDDIEGSNDFDKTVDELYNDPTGTNIGGAVATENDLVPCGDDAEDEWPEFGIADINWEANVDSAAACYDRPDFKDQDGAFKGGFTISNGLELFEATTPIRHPCHRDETAKTRTTRYSGVREPLVYNFNAPAGLSIKKPKSYPPTIIRSQGGANIESIPAGKKFTFRLFKYNITKPPQSWTPEKKAAGYIFTGTPLDKKGTAIVPGLLMPTEVLRIRLCGTDKERREAYMVDWLTYLAARVHYEHVNTNTKPEESAILDRIRGIHGYDQDEFCNLFPGDHLKMRYVKGDIAITPHDTAGPRISGSYFLWNLFGITHRSLTNIPEFIFQQWCRVARVASLAPRANFSINARFWKIPAGLDEPIKFIYTYTDDFEKGCRNLDFNDQQIERIVKVWRTAIETAHNSTFKNIKNNFDFRDRVEVNTGGFVSLGAHPQRFYEVFLSTEDYRKLQYHEERAKEIGHDNVKTAFRGILDKYAPSSNTVLGQQKKPGKKNEISLVPKSNITDRMSTTTIIKLTGITAAAKIPRCQSQNEVMGGVGAPAVAVQLGWAVKGARRTAEWLHRSAYSFGGPDTVQGVGGAHPDDSQDTSNLVFGTYETNTEMIRYESYLKRLVTKFNRPSVTLVTSTDVSSSTYHWFARYLMYAWRFEVSEAAVKDGQNHHILLPYCARRFDLFRRAHSTLAEVGIDEKFDSLWMEDFLQMVGEDSWLDRAIKDLDRIAAVALVLFRGQDDPINNPQEMNELAGFGFTKTV
ncbi:hypothetical protein TWF506_004171 [Arthrobotrys conoides]|uniref:Uncharacterized protein n=1 Tax=Arthrobotrys conoides TaxID=74498 RepID=A0AAN8N3R0_9PEZI